MTDLDAQLTIARDDMRKLADAYRLAFDLDLGYGVSAQSYEPRVTTTDTESPVLSDGTSPTIAAAVRMSLQHLAKAHWWYGELPDGHTVWPLEPLEKRDVSLTEALEGVAKCDLILAELQRTRDTFVSVQESAYALAVANHASEALHALPGLLWRPRPSYSRLCIDCGRQCQESGRSRCYACRQRLSRAVKARAS